MKKVKIIGKPKSYIGLIKTQYDKSFLYNNGNYGIEIPTHSQSKFATELTTLLNDQIALMQTEEVDLQHVKVKEYPSSTLPGKKDVIMKDAVHEHYIMKSMKV